jgi:hypothetical protein
VVNEALSSPEKTVELLMKKPLSPDQQTLEVSSFVADFPLSPLAQKNSPVAVQAIMESLTGQKALSISMISFSKAEVFVDSRHLESIKTKLSDSRMIALKNHQTTASDLSRRARAYLRGYFKTLRLASLNDFSPTQKLEVLKLAEALLPTIQDRVRRKKWKSTIQFDRAQLLSPQGEEADPGEML